MRLTGLLAAAFSLTAGAAFACPDHADCGRMDHHRHGGGWSHEEHYRAGGWERHERYAYGRRQHYERCADACAPPPRCVESCGEVVLPASFFYDAGGVGPIPDGGWYGGGGFVVVGAGAGAQASAFAAARASASASVSVRFRGGFKGHHKGHKGGKRH